MDKLDILDQIRHGSGLMSLPQSLADILREADNPNFTADALAQIILRDPSLTARILRLANSSFYQRFARTTTVHQAVQVLGVTTVKCLALSTSIFRPEKLSAETGIDATAMFTNMLTVATLCQKLAERVGLKATEEAMIAGLLQHIGVMFFLHHYPKEYKSIIAGEREASSYIDAERALFGTDHAEVGYNLALQWKLPAYVAESIRDHHLSTSLDGNNKISCVAALAAVLTHDSLNPYIAEFESRSTRIAQFCKMLNVDVDDITDINASIQIDTLQIAKSMEIDLGSIDQMLARSNREIWRTYLMVENLFKDRQELSRKLLAEEHARGALETKNIAMATLSHYINNSSMAIYGRSQIIRMLLNKGKIDELMSRLPAMLDVMDKAIKRTEAVLAEMKEISPIDQVEFLQSSQALNMDERLAKRVEQLAKETGLCFPDEVTAESGATGR